MINSYQFGVIIVNGRRYTSDVIIYPDRVGDNWWRREGHSLFPQDLEEVVREKPEIVVIGSGNSGLMKVPPSTRRWIEGKGIRLKVEPTQAACQIYNQLQKTHKIVAALHLTC